MPSATPDDARRESGVHAIPIYGHLLPPLVPAEAVAEAGDQAAVAVPPSMAHLAGRGHLRRTAVDGAPGWQAAAAFAAASTLLLRPSQPAARVNL
jgi:hypothetical protein